MQNLSVVVQNNSGSTTGVCLYRSFSNNFGPVAWRTQSAHWNLGTTFEWTEQWQFVWGRTQSLAGGTILRAGQAVDADPDASNEVTLTYGAASGFAFTGQKAGERPGNYLITVDGTVPPGQVAAGLGMAGVANAVVMAQPAAQIVFPINTVSMTATLSAGGSWSIAAPPL